MKITTKEEIAWISLAILIFGFMIGWRNPLIYAPYVFLISAVIILTNIIAKKIASDNYSIIIKQKVWSLQRYGLSENSKLKKPFPAGLVFPFFISLLSMGAINILIFLQFDAKNLPKKRLLRKKLKNRHSEINESDLAFASAWGFWALILLAMIGFLLKQPEIAKYSIYYGLWNLIPISNLDGIKIFFGSLINWIILAFVYFIFLIALLI